jgi:hypothetical protein
MFEIGDLVYLFKPKLSSLVTNSKKISTHYVGPLVVQAVFDDRLVSLCDLSGKLITGLFSIKQLKRAHFKVNHKNATNISDIKTAMDKLETLRKTDPQAVQITPQHMFCMKDGTTPENDNMNHYLTPVDHTDPLTNICEIPLTPYLNHLTTGHTQALMTLQTDSQLIKELRHESQLPVLNSELFITKGRYKDGSLEVLFTDRASFHQWTKIDPDSAQSCREITITPIVNEANISTGRANVHIIDDTHFYGTIPLTGSPMKHTKAILSISRQPAAYCLAEIVNRSPKTVSFAAESQEIH